uniref:CN hydrolase domain-containing protein n=1 Tax=Panagrellus redivivus TaxID=6233 RepID=A0A7E4VNI1_PANRE
MRLQIVPVPKLSQRLLWDQFRSMRYPPGYFARDDLSQKHSPLDWTADHPHTTFKALYDHLRSQDYFIEVLGEPITCLVEFDPTALSRYGAYLVVDPEEEYFPAELNLLEKAARTHGLSIIAFADWFNATLIEKIQFFDENTRQYWMPETGGCNIPALNELLQRFGFAFGDIIVDGHVENIGGNVLQVRSGSALIAAPYGAILGYGKLKDQGAELVSASPNVVTSAPVLGLNAITGSQGDGIIAVFGDSSCLETPNSGCFAHLDQMLASAESGVVLPGLLEGLVSSDLPVHSTLPKRVVKSNFAKYSQVVSGFDKASNPLFREIPKCRPWKKSPTTLIKNVTFPADMFPERHSLDVIEIERILGPRLLSDFDSLLDKNAAGLPQEYDVGVDEFEIPTAFYYCFWVFVVIIMLTGAFTARPRFAQVVVTKTLRAVLKMFNRV